MKFIEQIKSEIVHELNKKRYRYEIDEYQTIPSRQVNSAVEVLFDYILKLELRIDKLEFENSLHHGVFK